MNTTDRLVAMLNQIAANLSHNPDPVVAIEEHIRLFWDPRMKTLIVAHIGDGLVPTAAAAVARLASN